MLEISRGGIALLESWAASAGDWVDATDDDGAAIFLNDPAAVRAALRQPDAVLTGARVGPSKVIIGTGPLSSSGERWREQRGMLVGAFRENTIETWLPALVQLASNRAASWRDAPGDINLPYETSRLAQDMTAQVIFGPRGAAAVSSFVDRLTQAMNDTSPEEVEASMSGSIFGPLVSMLAEADAIHAMIGRAIEEGRTDHDRWPTTTAGRWYGQRPDPPSMDDIHLFTTLMVVTVLTLGPVIFWTLAHLSEDRAMWKRAQEEARAALGGDDVTAERLTTTMPTLRGALYEAIRLYPPYWIVTKTARAAAIVAGVAVEPETRIHLVPWLTQRDRRSFPDPARFDPSRWSDGTEPHALGAAFLPFLMGQRTCPARGLALPEALGAVAAVIATSDGLVPASADRPVPVVHSLALRVPASYRVRLEDAGSMASSATMRSSLV